jgi:hypothetical protein
MEEEALGRVSACGCGEATGRTPGGSTLPTSCNERGRTAMALRLHLLIPPSHNSLLSKVVARLLSTAHVHAWVGPSALLIYFLFAEGSLALALALGDRSFTESNADCCSLSLTSELDQWSPYSNIPQSYCTFFGPLAQ